MAKATTKRVDKRGGARRGAGRPRVSEEEGTRRITLRLPASHAKVVITHNLTPEIRKKISDLVEKVLGKT